MKPKGRQGLDGRKMLDRMNIVRLGTPSFGLANDSFWGRVNHRTITSSQDPFLRSTQKAQQWISTVKGHEIDDYLKDGEVRDRLREAFGYTPPA
jgi:hypothetical protein